MDKDLHILLVFELCRQYRLLANGSTYESKEVFGFTFTGEPSLSQCGEDTGFLVRSHDLCQLNAKDLFKKVRKRERKNKEDEGCSDRMTKRRD